MNSSRYLSAISVMVFIGATMVGCGSSDDDDPEIQANSPTAPTALQAVVYSSSAVELSWGEATDNSMVVEYQVLRDGALVATQAILRFYEDELAAGVTYTYQVLAVDDEGKTSKATEVSATTLDDGPIISEANYSVVLPYVVDIANGILIGDILDIVNDTDASWLSGANENDIAGLTLVGEVIDSTEIWNVFTFDCELGGAYEFHTNVILQFGGHFRGFYDECQIGSSSISGDFDRQATVNKGAPYNEILSSQYNVTVQNNELGSIRNLTGQLELDNSQVANQLSVSEASYYEHNLWWSTEVDDIEINVYATDLEPLVNYAEPFNRSFSASFRTQGPQTGGEPVTVVMDFNTDNENSLYYQTGSMTIRADDSSSLSMTLLDGDQSAFQLVFNQSGSTSASTIPWSDDYRLLCLQEPTFDSMLTDCDS